MKIAGDPRAASRAFFSRLGCLVAVLLLLDPLSAPAYAQSPLTEGDARLVYGSSTTPSAVPRTRAWDQLSTTWGAPIPSAVADSTIAWVVHAFDPADSAEELVAVLASVPAGGTVLHVLRLAGGVWFADWSSSAIAAAHAGKRGFDLAYEDQSAAALAVHSNNTANPVYRTWNGTSWSAETDVFAIPPGTGTVLWVELVARSGSDEIALVYADTSSDLFAVVWDGTQWASATTVTLETGVKENPVTGQVSNRAFDAAFVETTGDLLVAWGRQGVDGFFSATKAAGSSSWSAPANTLAPVNGVPHFVDLAAEPGGARIAGGFFDLGDGVERLGLATWNGSAWLDAGEYDAQMRNVNDGAPGDFQGAVGWQTAGNAIAVYADDQTGTLDWARWTAASGWTVEPDVAMPGKGETESTLLEQLPGQDMLMAVLTDDNADLHAATFDGAWTLAAENPLETEVTTLDTVPLAISALTTASTDLELRKSASHVNPDEGETVSYTIVVANHGPDAATGVEITDLLPPEVSFVTAIATRGSYDDASGVWTPGTMTAGATDTLVIDVTIGAGTGGMTVTNMAAVTAVDQTDPAPGNETDSAALLVRSIDLAVGKTVDNPAPAEGDSVTYTVTVTNTGPNDATGVTVTDLLPPGLNLVAATPSQGSYDGGSGAWDLGVLGAPGNLRAVRTGTGVIAGGSSSVTLAITPPLADPTRTILFFQATSSDTTPNSSNVRCVLVDAGTIQCDRDGTTGTVNIRWHTAEFVSGVTVQHLTPVCSGSITDVAIAPVDMNESFVLFSNRREGVTQGDDDFRTVQLTSPTNVRIEFSGTGCGAVEQALQVVEFDGAVVTRGATGVMSGTDLAVTGLAPVDPTRTLLLYGYRTAGAGPAMCERTLRGAIDTGTALRFARGDGAAGCDGTPIDDIAWERIEFPAGHLVQQVMVAMGDGVASADGLLSTIDPARSVALAGGQWTSGQAIGEGSFATDDILGAMLGAHVVAAGRVRVTRDHPSATARWTSYVIQFGAGTGTATLDLLATVAAGTGGSTITNTAAVTIADQTDTTPGNDTDSADIVVQSADLALSKTVDDPTPNEGDTIVYTVTLTSNGPDATTGVEVTDLLPAGLTWVSATPSAGVYDDTTGLWQLAALPAAASETLLITATVDTGTGGSTITNTAGVTASDQGDPTPGNDVATADLTVQSADLDTDKSVDRTNPNTGETIVYTVTLTNNGPDPATGVEVTDLLPAGLTFVSAVPSQGTYDDAGGLWQVGTLVTSTSAVLAITATVDAGTGGSTITNTASVTAADQADPAAGNNTASAEITVESADLDIDKSVNNTAPNEGDTVTFIVVLTNAGPGNTTGVEVTDQVPAGLSLLSATPTRGTYDSATGVWSLGAVPLAATEALALTATVDPGTAGVTITNTAAVTASDVLDPNPVNDADSAGLTVQSADLAVTKTVDDPAPDPGDPIVYTVTVVNNGPQGATGIEVTDLLPPELQFTGATPTRGSYTPGTGRWQVGNLPSGDSAVLVLSAGVDTAVGPITITNTAGVSARDQGDPDTANDTDTAVSVVRRADLAITKTTDNNAPLEGDPVLFTVTLDNLGPDDADGIRVLDLLPAGVTLVTAVPSTGVYDDVTGFWDVGTVGAGSGATLAIAVTVDPGTVGQTITNTATIEGAVQPDPQTGNDSDAATIVVQATSQADLALVKTADPQRPNEGDMVSFVVTLSNGGPDAATSVTVLDTWPAGLTLLGATPSAGVFDQGPGTWSLTALLPGNTETLALTAMVDAGTAGMTITNQARVESLNEFDPVTGNDDASVAIVVQAADLTLAHLVDDPTPNEGDEIRFTILLANTGPDPATGVVLTAPLPAGLTLAGATPSRGAFESGQGVWTLPPLAVGDMDTLVVTAAVDQGTGGATLTRLATITGADQTDPDPGGNPAAAIIIVQSADLAVIKTADRSVARTGDTITYTITVLNRGPHPASGVTITDHIPAGLSLVSASATEGSFETGTLSWVVGSLASGAGGALTLVTAVTPEAGSAIVNRALVTGAEQGDPDPSNDLGSAVVTIQLPDAVSSAMAEITPDRVEIGQLHQRFRYTIAARVNPGDLGVDRVEIARPDGFANLRIDRVTVDGVVFQPQCPPRGARAFCATSGEHGTRIVLGSVATATDARIVIDFRVATPEIGTVVEFASAVDHTSRGGPQRFHETEPGDADGDPGNGNRHTVEVIAVTRLIGATPNPARGGTAISFSLGEGGHARLTIYDPRGRLVRRLLDRFYGAGGGVISITWDRRSEAGQPVRSGVYFYELDFAGNRAYRATRKLVILR